MSAQPITKQRGLLGPRLKEKQIMIVWKTWTGPTAPEIGRMKLLKNAFEARSVWAQRFLNVGASNHEPAFARICNDMA